MADRPRTVKQLQEMLPEAAIEEVGERQELVIYTGWSVGSRGRLKRMVDPDLDPKEWGWT